MDKKAIYWVVAVAVIVVIGAFDWLSLSGRKAVQPPDSIPTEQSGGVPAVVEQVKPQDTTAALDASLNGIDVGDIDKEFKDIDQSIGNL